MNYCSECGAPVSLEYPPGDSIARYICTQCRTIHYQNPKIITGCVAEWQGKVLLCKRAIEPRYGKWTIPAGFLECGETLLTGASRETLEEACAEINQPQLFAIYNIPHISQVYVLFRASVKHGHAAAGAESLETGFFAEHEIPWDELAFPVNHEILQLYFLERQQQNFSVHMGDIIRQSDSQIRIIRN